MNTSNTPENPLQTALDRVHAAIDTLEQTVRSQLVDQQRQERNEKNLRLVVDENESLKQEHEQLNHAIDLLQDQYDDLQKVATNIYGKLDDSVRRITKIIGD